MVTYEEAFKKAKKLKKNITHCNEYSNAYVFSCEEERFMIGGSGPVVILKESGDAVNMVYYMDCEESGDHIRTFEI